MRKLRVLLGLFAVMALLMSVAGPAMADPPATPSGTMPLDISFTDCTAIDGQGAIVVSGITNPSQRLRVTKGEDETILTITEDGTYPLDPGEYKWHYEAGMGGGAGGDFTIGACPTPTATPTEPPPITGWNVSTADCTTVDGHGSITVTGFTGDPADNQQVAVTPGDLVITENGTYPLDPGTYNWGYADRIGGGGPGHDFTIGACPTPTPTVAPTPTPTPTVKPTPTATVVPTEETLPLTDTVSPTSSGGSGSVPPVLLVLGAVSAMALLLKPKRR